MGFWAGWFVGRSLKGTPRRPDIEYDDLPEDEWDRLYRYRSLLRTKAFAEIGTGVLSLMAQAALGINPWSILVGVVFVVLGWQSHVEAREVTIQLREGAGGMDEYETEQAPVMPQAQEDAELESQEAESGAQGTEEIPYDELDDEVERAKRIQITVPGPPEGGYI